MFMRILQINVNTFMLEQFREFYENAVIPELQKLPGCLYAGLNRSGSNPEEFISLTFWDAPERAENYEKSGVFQRLIEQGRPYFAESTEWKIQLSEELELQYEPVAEEPTLAEYAVVAQSDSDRPIGEKRPRMYVRIVSAKLKEGKSEELRQLYEERVIPVLLSTKGCRHAYLSENLQNKNEIISVTVWDSKEDADNYESTGVFGQLVDQAKHTFTALYQWKLALEEDLSRKAKTSDDLSIAGFKMVTGKSFD